MARAEKLYFQGEMVPVVVADDGTVIEEGPDRSFPGVPARDLDEQDILRLSDDQYQDITGGKQPLYTETPSGRARPKKSAKPRDEYAEAVGDADIPLDGAKVNPGTDFSGAAINEIPAA